MMRIARSSLCLGLLLALNTTLTSAQDREPKSASLRGPVGIPAQPTLNPLAAIPLSSLAGTRERPIFAQSRRPPPSSHPEVNGARNEHLVLLGAIASGANGIAILRDEQSKAVVRMRVGESLLGWQLVAVEGRNAILTNSGGRIELTIPTPAPK